MVDRNLPLQDIETQEEEIDEYLAGQRSLATLSTLFAAFALLLTSIGLYGAVSYAVGTRSREFGIRSALGASARDLIAMVLAQAFRQVLLGVAVGLPMAWVAAKVARSAVFGAGDFDPMVLLAAVATLSAAAFVAAWLPARRAGRVDPLIAIR
jgi:ABC-type antimicrobial peptide transport system permease subunit